MADNYRQPPPARTAWNLLGYVGMAGLVACVAAIVLKISEVL